MNTQQLTRNTPSPAWSAILSLALTLAIPVSAQDFVLEWWNANVGGGASSGGGYALSASIGQADAGLMSGGDYICLGGFWGVTLARPQVSARLESDGRVTLTWPSPSEGFELLESSAISGGSWTPVGIPPEVVGDANQVTLTPQPGPRFYRLRHP